ncbi:LysM peptidoglycan-binding domain-containing protein [Weissella confusa]|uniref:LysM peptidoglycan-binding domain-containing protein n=1 Tax=Weissella confusa TaxID=1583 RepID=A0A329G5W7_WEICO|nr:LysM domain-containing protein [Weissella confusa]MBA5932640.1 LysM peptidoglycan-binding domain-containing protein [Weissella confusa]MBC6499516.1 LysM peptidoglycan-binding domain-containing protein [Weissella confusa]MBJ7629484.1 LysM peptidoglycan-binding domain-containing protein [Weissella confusa]MBJ7633767.1 LysM peptidoglycan-binding domain-containing protein [Weissella confusa]MBJ7635913.1 LysM peptidoglycan-binding domain-containing protein [Weissella confusa]
MNKMKETALTVAGLASVLVAGQQVVHAASTYTVQNGDTLSELADKFNMTVEDLVKTNKISDANMIFTDQQIQVPTSAEVNQATLDSAAASSANSAAANAASVAASEAASSAAAASSVAASEAAASESAASSAAASSAAASKAAASSAAASAQQATTVTVSTAAGSGSVYDQFIAAGGTAALWNAIVLPESGGNPNAVSPNGYRGLGQTKQAWGTGSVAQQTAGLVNYAVSRYGSIDGAIQFRLANGWW